MSYETQVWERFIKCYIGLIEKDIALNDNDPLRMHNEPGQKSWECLKLIQSQNIYDDIDSKLKRTVDLILSNKNYIFTQRKLRQVSEIVNKIYKNIQSIFTDKKDHCKFLHVLFLLEHCKLTQQLPFCINQTISEFANGNVYFCSNSNCKEEIWLLDSESGEKYDNYCAISNQYWCKQCTKNLVSCDECMSIQCKPFAVACMNEVCKNENIYLCQNKKCFFYKDNSKCCNICRRIICGAEHDHWNFELDIVHCIQCQQLCCFGCSKTCRICDEMICIVCVSQYGSECKSSKNIKCQEIVMNHPSCQKHHCDCERKQLDYCIECVTHSCGNRFRVINGGDSQCCELNCKICASENYQKK